jgi:hypothetical protein
MAGTHTLTSAAFDTNSSTTNQWMTVTAAPGVARSDVIVDGTSGSGFNTTLLRLYNVTITGTIESGGPLVDSCWLDQCSFLGASGELGSSWTSRYMTDSIMTDRDLGPVGFQLVRNVTVNGIGGDVFSQSLCVINSSVANYVQSEGAHANIYQTVDTGTTNVVLYGIESSSADVQLFQFNVPPVDFAIVGCTLDATNWYAIVLGDQMTNILHKDCTFAGSFIVLDPFTPTNVVFDGCTINGLSVGDPGYPTTAGVTFR